MRGPREGVGCEAGRDGIKVMDEPANSQRTVDFSDSFPQGRCSRTTDGSGSEISNSWAEASMLWAGELHLTLLNTL